MLTGRVQNGSVQYASYRTNHNLIIFHSNSKFKLQQNYPTNNFKLQITRGPPRPREANCFLTICDEYFQFQTNSFKVPRSPT